MNSNRVMTIPNGITALRALGIPLFLYLYLHSHLAGWSFFVLGCGAATDYLDGKVARALNQVSDLGAKLDPTIDRAYIAATVVALAIRSAIPWWIVVVLIARDLWMALVLLLLNRRTGELFEVTFLGKAATFNLLYAFPLLLVAGQAGVAHWCGIFGWAFVIWGLGLYLLTGIHYSFVGFQRIRRLQGDSSSS
jgi:cardiolipin synthase